MEIREIAISHYGPLRDIRYKPNSGLQIFYGPNESGKTLLIDAILKLMLGNRLRDFAGIDRVPDPPQGRVALSLQGQEHILDGSTRLDQISGLDSNHLRNVFVIRNKDLQMDGQARFLRRVSDQLTGMEGQRLTDLKEILRQRGSLTNSSSTARLSKSADFNKIGEHVETAEALGKDIQEYLQEAHDLELDTLERRLEDTRQDLTTINRQILNQELAEKWQNYNELTQLVADYEVRAETAHSLQAYTQRTFIKLQDLQSRAQANRDTALDSQVKLDQLLPRLEGAIAKLAEAKAKLSPLENRKPQLDNLEQRTLMAAGTPPPPASGALGKFSYGLLAVAGIGLVLAAVNMLPSLLVLTPYLALAGAVILWFADRSAQTKASEHRHRDRILLQEGATSGIMAETLQELAAAVSREKTNMEQTRNHLLQLAETVRTMEQKHQHLEELNRNAAVSADKFEQQLKRELQELGVDSLERFGTLMVKYNRAQTQCDELHQRLEDAFEQVPSHIGGWRGLLQQRPVPENPETAFDQGKLLGLRQEKDAAQAQIDQIQNDLHLHQAALANYAAACQGLPLDQETGLDLPARFANLEVLEHACTVLGQFASSVRTRFTIACEALAILEELELEEQEKMTDLVGPDKPVQDIFHTITGGRYTGVTLDGDLNIMVKNQEGLDLPASALSQGTYDQLYLALRLSLARDLLAGETGFLLLDDAFLCADSVRLERMLAVLAEQAAQGWHILYFTMDERLAQAAPRHTSNEIIRLNPLFAT